MDGWQPLAPTKRASGMYARTNSAIPGGLSAPLPAVQSKAPEQLTKEERRVLLLQGPSDPFPPIGPFPRSVALHILSYVPLSQQRNCALAGRALARAVADERNWRRRLDALDWCAVDGLTVKFGDGESHQEGRLVGRRRRRIEKQDVANGDEDSSSTRKSERNFESRIDTSTKPQSPSQTSIVNGSHAPQSTGDVPSKDKANDADDDFGDFADPSNNAGDAFGDFQFENNKLFQNGGSSLASGMASVAMGGGRPHNFNASGAPTFTPLTPVKVGNGAKSQTKTIVSPRPRDAHKSHAAAEATGTRSIFSYTAEATLPLCSSSPSFRILRAHAQAMKPFIKSLADTSMQATSSLLFTCDLGLPAQTALLSNILRFFSTSVGGGRRAGGNHSHSIDGFREDEHSLSLRAQDAARHLLDSLLSSFEGTLERRSDAKRAAAHGADTTRAIRRAEDDMQTHANGIWELGNARLALALSELRGMDEKGDLDSQLGRMKAAKVFLERCDILSNGLKHNPLDNLSPSSSNLDFTAMDTFMSDLINIVQKDGELIARIFPPEQDILLAYADNVAHDVINKYTRTLLEHVKSISTHLYLRSCAATFAQSWKLVGVLMVIEPRDAEIVTQTRCEDVIFRSWESNVDEYLEAERRWVRQEMEGVTERWESDVENDSGNRVDTAFLNSQNPAAVKRSVLSGFKDVLLLPVTVVPRTAGIVGGAVIRTAGTGLSTLNPLRWQAGGASSGKVGQANDLGKGNTAASSSNVDLPRTPNEANEKGYIDFSSGAVASMDSDSDDDDDNFDDRNLNSSVLDLNEHDEWNQEVAVWSAVASSRPEKESKSSKRRSKLQAKATSRAITGNAPVKNLATPTSASSSRPVSAALQSKSTSRSASPMPGDVAKTKVAQMQLLLSLDTALQVIHVNRDCLRRVETFKKYPMPIGGRVKEAMEEISLLLFRALGEGHLTPGFEKAISQIQDWKPEDHNTGAGGGDANGQDKEVEPLVGFFELVHVGDTIAQMVQVYFEQEIARHIDKQDFLNPVVKGRKRFEGNLDEAVARGLNAGVDLLLGQAEHIIATRQSPNDYNPSAGQLNDLTPTRACKEAVECLRVHCRMLVGSTDKNVLEVFYQEVGIRLHAIICKHLKHQIISLDGGFRVIADLNEYHAFIVTLRQPTLTADFSALKMLGNLYIIDNPKELAKLARDANMFGETLSPEDLYEFLQSRSDFRSIEKAIDKEMYGFKVSEDCCIA